MYLQFQNLSLLETLTSVLTMKLKSDIPLQRRNRRSFFVVRTTVTSKFFLSMAFVALVVYTVSSGDKKWFTASSSDAQPNGIEKYSRESPFAVDCALFLNSSSDLAVLPAENHNVHVVQAEHPFDMSLHDTEHEVISRSINQEGCFECLILFSLLNALKKSPDASLIDIGGNIGMYSLYAASYGHNAITFEPMKINQEKICQSILSNIHFQDRITLIGAATSDSSASKYVDFNTKGFKQAIAKKGDLNYGSGIVKEFHSENNAPPPGDRGVHYAHSLTIDSLQGTKHLPQPGSHIVLKVDVEGSECKALLGSLIYLSTVKIDYAAIELSYVRMQQCHQDGGALEKIFDLFTSNGLELYLSSKNEWMKVDPVNWIPWARERSAILFDIAWSKGIPNMIL